MLRFLPGIVATALLSATLSQASGEGPHWSYEGKDGPQHWGDLTPDFVQCKVGVNQSPIDVTATINADLPPLEIDYPNSTVDLVNNGHTAAANVEPGNFMRVGGETFELVQIHLHTPSEHRINGKSFLMETHYVHKNAAGQLAVIGLLHDAGPRHEGLAYYQSSIPPELHKTIPFKQPLKKLAIHDVDLAYYRYNGSLTTPPCTEGVRWFLLKEPSLIAPGQQLQYHDLIGDDARGPQPINARVVLE